MKDSSKNCTRKLAANIRQDLKNNDENIIMVKMLYTKHLPPK
jgi:hypothetical protein